MATLITSIQYHTGDLSNVIIRQRKESHKDWRESKTDPFHRQKNAKEFIQQLLKEISEYRLISEYKINTKKSYTLAVNNWKMKFKKRNTFLKVL